MTTINTQGALDALANRLAAISSLSLTKGTNLFAENVLDDPNDSVTDHLVLFHRGFRPLSQYDHFQIVWEVAFATSRRSRIGAMDAVLNVGDAVIGLGRFTATSDDLESFQVLKSLYTEPSVTLTERLESGRYLAEASLQLQVIPF